MDNKRQLSDVEKKQVLDSHQRRCFVDGAPIGEEEPIHFHHIRPYSEGGPTSLDNIAPVCKTHHMTMGTMSLQEYKDKVKMGQFFEGGPKYLDDVILSCGHKQNPLKYEIDGDQIRLYLGNARSDCPLHVSPVTRWRYFYALLPVTCLWNDKDLQPRALRQGSMWGLYRHFQKNTQLSPSICRLHSDGRLLLFDGQHKAAAQIWAGRGAVECKVYLEPDPKVLKETNLEAHGAFRQMSFYSHELMTKYADIFGEDWAEYMASEGEKSERGFFDFLVHRKKKTRGQARKEISHALYNRIVNAPDNKLSAYLSEKHRGPKQPLSFHRLQKTFLSNMVLSPPLNVEFESDKDFREAEQRNLVRLMSIVAEEMLEEKWNPDRNDAAHKRAERLFSAGAVRAWVILLKNVINIHLKHYTDEQRDDFFYRLVPDAEFNFFRTFVHKICSHKIWDDPDPDGSIGARLAKDDAITAKKLFEEHGLTAQWVLGG